MPTAGKQLAAGTHLVEGSRRLGDVAALVALRQVLPAPIPGQGTAGSCLVEWSIGREVKWSQRGKMSRDLLAFIGAAAAADRPAPPPRHENRSAGGQAPAAS